MAVSPLQTVRLATRALTRNKMRSTLTTLGIVIGVGAVIAMVAIGEGARVRVAQTFEAMGTNLLIVLPGSNVSGGMQSGFGSLPTLTWEDLHAIRTELPAVQAAAPTLRASSVLQVEDQNWTTGVVGTTPEYLAIRNWTVAQGRAFSDDENTNSAKVILLGTTVVGKLWNAHANPVGQVIRVGNIPFTVIGVLESKGQSPMGSDYDDTAIVPAKTFQTKIQGGLGQFINGAIMVSATTPEATERAQGEIVSLLRDRHHLAVGVDDDFSVRNLQEIAAAQQAGTAVLTTLLAAIAAVSLLVGGIGIMNIMLVSVTERTREIGVRMAVGARPRDIMMQFVVEALTLSLAGGAIGVAFGLIGAWQLAVHFHWPMVIRPAIIGLSVGFSALVGLIFGLYPARKASLFDPIEALRFE
jgi:putative ABC transport system permease protein